MYASNGYSKFFESFSNVDYVSFTNSVIIWSLQSLLPPIRDAFSAVFSFWTNFLKNYADMPPIGKLDSFYTQLIQYDVHIIYAR